MGLIFYSDIQLVFFFLMLIWQFYVIDKKKHKKNSRHTPVRWTTIYRFTPVPHRQNDYDNAYMGKGIGLLGIYCDLRISQPMG